MLEIELETEKYTGFNLYAYFSYWSQNFKMVVQPKIITIDNFDFKIQVFVFPEKFYKNKTNEQKQTYIKASF